MTLNWGTAYQAVSYRLALFRQWRIHRPGVADQVGFLALARIERAEAGDTSRFVKLCRWALPIDVAMRLAGSPQVIFRGVFFRRAASASFQIIDHDNLPQSHHLPSPYNVFRGLRWDIVASDNGKTYGPSEAKIKDLHAKIGRLAVEPGDHQSPSRNIPDSVDTAIMMRPIIWVVCVRVGVGLIIFWQGATVR